MTYNAPVLAKSIEIECEGESDLFGGEDTKLKVVAEPKNAFDSYIWESEDPEVAVVDQEGNVFALNEGVATIKCTSKATKNVYSEFIVTVSGSAGSNLIIKPESKDELNPGDTVQMKIKTALLDDTFTWSSSDTSVATVDENGLVTILKNGKFTITCKSNETLDAVSTYDFTIGKAKGCNAAMSAIFSLWGFVLVGLVKVFVRRKKNIF